MKKRFLLPVLIIVAVFIAGTAAGVFLLSYQGVSISTGVCLVTDNGSVFLIDNNSPIRLSDYSEKGDRLTSFKTGDKILAVHDGIQESYPASTGVLFCIKLGEGMESEIPELVILSLKELGWITDADIPSKSVDISFTAEYIRTELPGDEAEFPVVRVISTADELNEYSENKAAYGLNEEFFNQIQKYDVGFFEENALILCLLEENSGSNSHEIIKVAQTDGAFTDIFVKTIRPEVGTCDMAYHHIFTEVRKSDIADTRVRLFIDGVDRTKKYETVRADREYANISLLLPEGWGYETELKENSADFSVTVYHKDRPEENFTIEFLTGFGVCGTGLRTEDTEINGYKASKGIYDGDPTFSFISFEDTPGHYVIFNNADGEWWSEFGEEAREILGTLKIADGIIFRTEALDIASKYADGEYKKQYSEFDCEKGMWSFIFEKTETSQTIKISADGTLIQ